MTIQYCSDLHLEFKENAIWLKANPLVPAADILVLEGVFIHFREMEQCADFFSLLADHFRDTYWLPGNHEYYGGNISLRSGSFHEGIRSNEYLLNNLIPNRRGHPHFSTLWSNISAVTGRTVATINGKEGKAFSEVAK